MKYYAVKRGLVPGVYTTWDECSNQVTGFPGAIFKSFKNKADAEAFISDTKQTAPQTKSHKTHNTPYAYVDGSFNKKTNAYGYGGFLVNGSVEYILQGCASDKERASMRNVAGELDGCMAAIEKAIQLGLPKIEIYYDYQGIESWATHAWRTNNPWTHAYQTFMDKARAYIDIVFIKVAGHTGVEGNERADKLAKEAVGLK